MNPTTGTITSGLYVYDKDADFLQGCSFTDIAPCQRLKVCIKINKDDYNSELIANGGTGNFDDNLSIFSVTLSDTMPVNGYPFQVFRGLPVEISDNGTEYEICVTIVAKDEYINTTKYLVFNLNFDITHQDGTTYTDQVRKVVNLSFKDYDDGTGIELLGYFDEDGNEVLKDFICEGTTTRITPRFKSNIDGVFSQIAVYHPPNGITQEDNGYFNGGAQELPLLNSSLITFEFPLPLVNQSDNYQFDIDTTQLPLDEEVCFKTILINEAPSLVTVTCPCVTLDFQIENIAENGAQKNIKYVWNITPDTPINNQDVSSVDVFVDGSLNQSFINVQTGNGVGFVLNSGDPISYDVIVTLASGCIYNFSFILTVPPINTTGSYSNEICLEPCDVTLSSNPQTCNFSLQVNNPMVSFVTDSCDRQYNYDVVYLNDCGAATITESITDFSTGCLYDSCYRYLTFPSFLGNGAFINEIKVHAYDGVTGAIVDTLIIDLSSIVVSGVVTAAFVSTLQAEIEAQISGWNIPTYGTGATNGVDYDLTVTQGAVTLDICFDFKHLPNGLWIGVDINDYMSTYTTTAAGQQNAITVNQDFSQIIDLDFARDLNFLCGIFRYKIDFDTTFNAATTNFYNLEIVSYTTSVTADGDSLFPVVGTSVMQFDCTTELITATPMNCDNPTYTWNGSLTTFNPTIYPYNGTGAYTVQINCDNGCTATETINII